MGLSAFARQKNAMGMKDVPVLNNINGDAPDLITAGGVDVEDNVYVETKMDTTNPKVKDFIKLFEDRFEHKSYGFTVATSYDTLYILSKVIAKSGYGTEKILQGIKGFRDYEGISATFKRFTEEHDVDIGVKVVNVKNGEFRLVKELF